MRLTKLQRSVARKAAKRMKKEPWYREVCLDMFMQGSELESDVRIKEIVTERALKAGIHDTY